MKRLSWVFIIIIIVVVGWYFLWLKSLEKVESLIAQNIERFQLSNESKDVDVHYTLKPKGFPFKAGYVVENVGFIFNEKGTQHRAKVSTNGYNFVYVSFFDFYEILTQKNLKLNAVMQDFEAIVNVSSPDENVEARFNIARFIGEFSLSGDQKFQGTISDLDVYVNLSNLKENRILTVNQLKFNNKQSLKAGLLDILSQMDVLGATFYDLEGENSFEVDQFNFNFNITRLPAMGIDIFKELRLARTEKASGERIDSLKKALLEYFNKMQKSGTDIKLNDYKVKIDEFTAEMNFDFKLNELLKPVGRANIKFKNIAALNNLGGRDEAPVDLTLFSKKGQDLVSVLLESDGQKISLNGFPVLRFVPSISFLLDNLKINSAHNDQRKHLPIVDKTDALSSKGLSSGLDDTQTLQGEPISETTGEGLGVNDIIYDKSLPEVSVEVSVTSDVSS